MSSKQVNRLISSDNGIIVYNYDVNSIFQDIVNVYHPSACIMDPPYDKPLGKWLLDPIPGNKIVFCKPENQYFIPDEYLFWVKTPSTKNFKKKCGRFVELILVKRGGSTFNMLHWSQMTGVYDDRLVYNNGHPYEKPLTLMERLVRVYTNPGDIVVDWFAGSLTTALACRRLGRYFVGVEICKDFIDIGKARFLEDGIDLSWESAII